MTGCHLRSYETPDASAFLALSNRASGFEVPLARFLEQEAVQPGRVRRRRVADLGGEVIGVAEVQTFDFIPPDWLRLILCTAPQTRGRGVGNALLAWALHEAASLATAGLEVSVLDDDPGSREWAVRRGFALHAHRFASELDLRRDFPAPELPPGVTLRDMQGATPADWDRLEVLYGDLMTQTPDLAGEPRWTPEQLRAHVSGNPRLRPDWQLVAVGPDCKWLGLCQGLPISTGIYNEFTAVVPQARGQGLARAMKLELIRRARLDGVPKMRTDNHAANLAMLSVNARLGFVPQTGSWELRRKLT